MKIEQSYMHRSSQPVSKVKDNFAQDPDLTYNQKRKNIQRAGIACAFGIFLSLPQIIMPFFFSDEVLQSLQIQMIAFGCINLVLSIVGFCWSRSKSILGNKTTSYGGYSDEDITIYYNPLGDCLFGFGSFFVVVNLIMVYVPFALYNFNRSQYIALHGEDSSSMVIFHQHYYGLFITYSIISFLMGIILSIGAYASYHCSVTFKTLRIFGNIYNLTWGSFCIWGAWTIKKIQAFLSVRGYNLLISENQLNALYIILLVFASFSFLIYLTITLKKRKPHVTLGTFLLILIVILAGMNHGITKSALEIKRTYTKNCVFELNELPESDVLKYARCVKYVKNSENELDTTCKDSESLEKYFKHNWEKTLSEGYQFYPMSPQNACLNGNCCRNIGSFYAYYPTQLFLIVINLTFHALLIAYICFHLSHKEKIPVEGKKDSSQFNLVDGFFLLMLLGLLIGAILTLNNTSTTLPDYRLNHISPNPPPPPAPEPQPPQPQPAQPEPQPEPTEPSILRQQLGKNAWLNEIVNNEIFSMKNYSNQQCQLVKNLIDDEYFNGTFDFNVDANSEGKGIRVSLLASRGYFKYEKDNSGKLFFLETADVKNIVFSFISNNSAKKNMPFFSILGSPKDVNQFLNNQLYYCGTNPANLPHFLIENYVTEVPEIASPSQASQVKSELKKSITSHSNKSHSKQAIKDAFLKTSPGTIALLEKFENFNSNKNTSHSSGVMESGDSYPQEQCHNFYNEEQQKTDICNFYYGNLADRQGSFSFIAKPLKVDSAKQNIIGRVVAIDSKETNRIKYIPVCNQNVIVNIINEVGQEVLLAQAQTDAFSGQFTFQIPILPNTVRYSANMLISNKQYQETIKVIQLGGLNSGVDQQIGDIHLTNIYNKPQELDASYQCTANNLQPLAENTLSNKQNKKSKVNKQKLNKDKSLNQLKKTTTLVDDWCAEYTNLKSQNEKYCPFNSLYNTQSQQPISASYAIFKTQPISGEQELPPISRHNTAKISSVQFRNIQINLQDMSRGRKDDPKWVQQEQYGVNESQQISVTDGAVVKLYRNNINCSGGFNEQSPLFIGEPESSDIGKASMTIYNQVFGDYTLEVTYKNKNYHSYCQPFTLSYDETATSFILNAPIVRRDISQKGSGVVVLENRFLQNGSEHLGASLGMSIIFNDEKECFVSSYNRRCADYTYVKTSFAQAISFKTTYNRNSLFFVSKMATTPSEQTIIEESRVTGKDISQNPQFQVNNSVFLQQDIVVKVYAPESDYEVASYYPPIYDSKLAASTQLTWLSFCFDGSYGLISQKPINDYYNAPNKKKQFPNATQCDSFYKKNPYQGPK